MEKVSYKALKQSQIVTYVKIQTKTRYLSGILLWDTCIPSFSASASLPHKQKFWIHLRLNDGYET